MTVWSIELRGGAYDAWTGKTDASPAELLVAWVCGGSSWGCAYGCDGHATFDPHDEAIVLKTAEAYRRAEVDLDERLAIYEVGEPSPERLEEFDAERELVGAGDNIGGRALP